MLRTKYQFSRNVYAIRDRIWCNKHLRHTTTEKYDNNGKGWYFRFNDDNNMSYNHIQGIYPRKDPWRNIWIVELSPYNLYLSASDRRIQSTNKNWMVFISMRSNAKTYDPLVCFFEFTLADIGCNWIGSFVTDESSNDTFIVIVIVIVFYVFYINTDVFVLIRRLPRGEQRFSYPA